jgi:hypothetical protein
LAIVLYPEHVLRPSSPMQLDTPVRTRAQHQEQLSTTVEDPPVDAPTEKPLLHDDLKPLTVEEDSQMIEQLPQEHNEDEKSAFAGLSHSTPWSPGVPTEELLKSDRESTFSLPDESWKAFQDS